MARIYDLKASNGHRRTFNSVVPRGGPLDNGQKANLCILAKEAFALAFTDLDLESWRRSEQVAAVGKASLRDCVQADFLPLQAHFLRLGGEEGDATRTENRALAEPKRVAMAKLRAECAAREMALSYPAAICARQFKCRLEEASAGQIWKLVFTVRNRRKPVAKNVDEPF